MQHAFKLGRETLVSIHVKYVSFELGHLPDLIPFIKNTILYTFPFIFFFFPNYRSDGFCQISQQVVWCAAGLDTGQIHILPSVVLLLTDYLAAQLTLYLKNGSEGRLGGSAG